MTEARRVLRIAVDVPLSRLFDYLPHPEAVASPGCRVRAPFGGRTRVGIVMAVGDSSDLPAGKLKRITEVLDGEPILSVDELKLIRFTSDYYHHPIGEVTAAALPALLRQGRPLTNVVKNVSLTKTGATADLNELAKRAPRQAELVSLLKRPGVANHATLDDALPGWRRTRKALMDKGLIEEFEVVEDDVQLTVAETECAPELNGDQAHAYERIRASDGFSVSLIDCVTGSGKTEVYLRLIRDVIDKGLQALVLVPEIGLTPQLVQRLRRRLGVEPVLMHSGLTDVERLASWRCARNGSAQLIVGTRSAVFTPLAAPGLIVVDEEHDSSLKQQEGLRYSARDLAVARGKQRGVPVVLGSATPSLESLRRCAEGAYQHLRLPHRAGGAVPPRLRLVDLTQHDSSDGLTDPVREAIKHTLAEDGQVLVFLNRRGFAPTLICSGCGRIAECERCDARMTVHAARNQLECHHCGANREIDTRCPDCGADCRPLGQGTERLEESLRREFPIEAIARIDSDSTRLKGAMTEALAKATAGETRILVGTQMLSKGHHFPKLSLVVVINADQGLFSTDFRGSERLAQSLVQVAGRSGREARQGEVMIQTAYPKHPFWAGLFEGGYENVAAATLAEREQTAWPPFSRLAATSTRGSWIVGTPSASS